MHTSNCPWFQAYKSVVNRQPFRQPKWIRALYGLQEQSVSISLNIFPKHGSTNRKHLKILPSKTSIWVKLQNDFKAIPLIHVKFRVYTRIDFSRIIYFCYHKPFEATIGYSGPVFTQIVKVSRFYWPHIGQWGQTINNRIDGTYFISQLEFPFCSFCCTNRFPLGCSYMI